MQPTHLAADLNKIRNFIEYEILLLLPHYRFFKQAQTSIGILDETLESYSTNTPELMLAHIDQYLSFAQTADHTLFLDSLFSLHLTKNQDVIDMWINDKYRI